MAKLKEAFIVTRVFEKNRGIVPLNYANKRVFKLKQNTTFAHQIVTEIQRNQRCHAIESTQSRASEEIVGNVKELDLGQAREHG